MYARLSETYDAAESVPTQLLANVDKHAAPRLTLRKLPVHESKPKAVNREPASRFRLSSLRVAHCVTSRSRIVLRTSNIPNCTPDGAVAMGACNGSAGTRYPCANAT